AIYSIVARHTGSPEAIAREMRTLAAKQAAKPPTEA
ncbi:MAG: hypothetical protein ACI8SI_002712, partial [Congregibacter sp.]